MPEENAPGHPLAPEFVSALGASNVLQEEVALAPYRADKSPYPEIEPGIVVRPGSVDEICKVLQLANSRRQPVIVRGGGFSMTGFLQAAPHQAIVLDTRRLNRVLEIDEVNMTVTAEAGVIMSDLDAAVAARGFEVKTVGVPIQYTTLGGVLSGVVGGGLPRDSTDGLTGRQLVGLKVVLADGSVLQTNAGGANVNRSASAIPGGDGPFLTGLFVGDGGSLGVKVEATLQIAPEAPHEAAGYWIFDDFDSLWRALGLLAAIREVPHAGIGVAEGPPWSMSFNARASTPELLALQVRRIESVLEVCGARRGESDASGVPSREWFVSVDRAVVSFIVGRAQFVEAHKRVRTLLEERIRERRLSDLGVDLKIYVYPQTRHAMFTSISVLFDKSVPGSRESAVTLAIEAYELVVSLGGYLEPQQGVASQIIGRAWSPTYRRVFLAIKSAVDPNMILNPGVWALEERLAQSAPPR
jgi:FAD/FMN-containing dehydrogenase